jgi:hypothetical protein
MYYLMKKIYINYFENQVIKHYFSSLKMHEFSNYLNYTKAIQLIKTHNNK